ncbi:5-(carboxyamino)imidazole ribonucleotide mutase [Candidatus Saccharibacteria bacterium]|jgi:5-(carboxyamino)imidazole ribonucleotide mutase|nr:5-(carboxyamino)imidazole ribonucleotide mutase [Candidatus Saccharibacteria bacterium]
MIKVGIIMGSDSDMDIMQEAASILNDFEVEHEIRIISAHRTPDLMDEYAKQAKSRGLQVIIAGAGGSAHLPGMTASHTTLPVIAVPIKRNPADHEALWSNIKMPPGVPLATMPENGAKNAALLAIEILAINDISVAKKYELFRAKQYNEVVEKDSQLNHSE